MSEATHRRARVMVHTAGITIVETRIGAKRGVVTQKAAQHEGQSVSVVDVALDGETEG